MFSDLFNQEWSYIALLFFGLVGFIAWIRWRDQRWIEKTYGRENVLAMSFGVNFFGLESEPGKPKSKTGFLLLTKDKIVFKSRYSKLLVEISGESVRRIYPDNSHKGFQLHQSVLIVEFIGQQSKTDSMALRVPYPPQWINAMKNITPNLIKSTADSD